MPASAVTINKVTVLRLVTERTETEEMLPDAVRTHRTMVVIPIVLTEFALTV
jgi:hypothetical protein